ncbi:DUF2970 domain-containing protein [Methylocaldum szegediense]|uniref:DUF2970 domain-containing protein n=1 Tax=Methylocaldum szegediense TaxID=73780 RepID=A0ABN8X0C0_9GAMM|nr:DUF2970 domain-containing protein [Methylocaldum szegediense]CAI8794181.1 conserved protein of unknown function [Methylocaldum szegediense]
MSSGEPDPNKPSVFQVIASVIAAAFGVQSSANRERDFAAGSAKSYIIGGVIFTVLFVAAIIFIVNMVIKSAGT